MLGLSLRLKIFLSLIAVLVPLLLLVLLNYSSVLNFLTKAPGYSSSTAPVLAELLSIESKVERFGKLLQDTYSTDPEAPHRELSEIRLSLSIIENLLNGSTDATHFIHRINKDLGRLAELVKAYPKGCDPQSIEFLELESNLDENIEELLQQRVQGIAASYLDLREQIKNSNRRSIWTVGALMLILFMASYMLASRLSSQIVALDFAIRQFRLGATEISLPKISNDEVGRLIKSFDELQSSLRISTVTRNYLQSLLDQLGEGVVVTGLDGIIEVVNPSANSLLSNFPALRVGEKFIPLTIGASIQSDRQQTLTIQEAGGEQRRVVITRAPLFDDRELLQGFVYGVNDQTEQWRLEQKLTAHRTLLERGERIMALGTLGAIVAHKLSQPISSTKLFIQQSIRELSSLPAATSIDEKLKLALQEITRVSNAISQMMRTKRKDDLIPSEKCRVNAQQSVLNAISSLKGVISQMNANIYLDLP